MGSFDAVTGERLLIHRARFGGSPRPDRRRSGVGSPAQALQLTPQTLARPSLAPYERDAWPGLPHDGRAVVHVAGRGDDGSDTRLDRLQDLDDALAIGDERLHPITCTYLRRRLRRRSIHENVAALAQPCREGARLHEAHSAQPAIDTDLVDGGVIGHAFKDGTARGAVETQPAKRVGSDRCRLRDSICASVLYTPLHSTFLVGSGGGRKAGICEIDV